jgi:outer membrane protein TolC
VQEALKKHPLLRASGQSVQAAAARLGGANVLPNPLLNLQHGFGKDASGLDQDIVVSETIPLWGKMGYRAGEAKHGLAKARADRLAVGLDIAFQTRAAFVDLQSASAMEEQARKFLKLSEDLRATIDAQVQAGDVARTRLLRAEIDVALRRKQLDEAITARETSALQLNTLMGRASSAALVADGNLATPPELGTLESWRAKAAGRPALQSATAELNARRSTLSLAKRANLPDFQFQAIHADVTRTRGDVVTFGVVLPLFDFGSNRARAREASSLVKEQEALAADTARLTEVDVQVAYNQATRAMARLSAFRTGSLDNARLLADLIRVGYEAGESSLLELLDARNALFEAEAGQIQILATALRAELELERAAGDTRLLGPNATGGLR